MPRQTVIVEACTKELRINDKGRHHKMQQCWGIKPQGKDAWINVYGLPARPAKGQELVLEVGCDQWTPKGSQEVKLSWWADYVPNKAIPEGPTGWPTAEQPPKPPIPSLPEPQMASAQAEAGMLAVKFGMIPWSEYERTLRVAHAISLELEGMGAEWSAARAAITNTIMIAFTQGKIAAPAPEPIASQTPMDNKDWPANPADDDITW